MSFRWPNHKVSVTPLDYSVSWRRWLDGRSILSSSWEIENADGVRVPFTGSVDGLFYVTDSFTSEKATLVLYGGVNNKDYSLFNTIVPSSGASYTVQINLRTKDNP